MICAEVPKRRLPSSVLPSIGLPFDMWQPDQYSPVTPTTRGLAASSAGVAAICADDLIQKRAPVINIDSAVRRILFDPCSFATPVWNELTTTPRQAKRRESSFA